MACSITVTDRSIQRTMKLHFFWWRIASRIQFILNGLMERREQRSEVIARLFKCLNLKKKQCCLIIYIHPPFVCVCARVFATVCQRLTITSATASLEGNQLHISHEPHWVCTFRMKKAFSQLFMQVLPPSVRLRKNKNSSHLNNGWMRCD